MKEITIASGQTIKVSDHHYAAVSNLHLRLDQGKVAHFEGRQRIFFLHRYLSGVTDRNLYVKTLNGDYLDCRENNLLVMTPMVSRMRQQSKTYKKNTDPTKIKRNREKWKSYYHKNKDHISQKRRERRLRDLKERLG